MKKILKLFKNTRLVKILIVLLVTLIVTGGYIFISKKQDRVTIENSIITAPIVNIFSAGPGRVHDVLVEEGDSVQKGDALATVGSQTLKAYASGVVMKINDEPGSDVSQQIPVIQILVLTDEQVVGTVDEDKGLSLIKTGQVAAFTVDALPGKTFWGYVDHVAPAARQTGLSFSISSERPIQQFDVYARFNASEYPEIKNGMSAKLTIYTKN